MSLLIGKVNARGVGEMIATVGGRGCGASVATSRAVGEPLCGERPIMRDVQTERVYSRLEDVSRVRYAGMIVLVGAEGSAVLFANARRAPSRQGQKKLPIAAGRDDGVAQRPRGRTIVREEDESKTIRRASL